MPRRTKIVGTLGPATDPPDVLAAVIAAGLDVARINFSHGAADDHLDRIRRLREAAKAKGMLVAVLGDLPGPKLRAILNEPMSLSAGQKITLALKTSEEADIQLT